MQSVAFQNFILIEDAAQAEIKRLLPHPDYIGQSRDKAQKIMGAVDRIYLAVVAHDPKIKEIHIRSTIHRISPDDAKKLDFNSLSGMLDANISEFHAEVHPWTEGGQEFDGHRAGYWQQLSLREALNIANYNFFNFLGGTWGPLWGRAKALENVESKLKGHENY